MRARLPKKAGLGAPPPHNHVRTINVSITIHHYQSHAQSLPLVGLHRVYTVHNTYAPVLTFSPLQSNRNTRGRLALAGHHCSIDHCSFGVGPSAISHLCVCTPPSPPVSPCAGAPGFTCRTVACSGRPPIASASPRRETSRSLRPSTRACPRSASLRAPGASCRGPPCPRRPFCRRTA